MELGRKMKISNLLLMERHCHINSVFSVLSVLFYKERSFSYTLRNEVSFFSLHGKFLHILSIDDGHCSTESVLASPGLPPVSQRSWWLCFKSVTAIFGTCAVESRGSCKMLYSMLYRLCHVIWERPFVGRAAVPSKGWRYAHMMLGSLYHLL